MTPKEKAIQYYHENYGINDTVIEPEVIKQISVLLDVALEEQKKQIRNWIWNNYQFKEETWEFDDFIIKFDDM